MLRELQVEAAYDGTLDDTLSMPDGSRIRTHQHAAGACEKGASTT